MVSFLLLTTEEILQKNGFWCYLDTIWVAEEMEPFDKIAEEHIFRKPLSRDHYYAKYPDIPRSESDDDSSLTVGGFQSKHYDWQSKICIRKYQIRRRSLSRLNFSQKTGSEASLGPTRRVTSLVNNLSAGADEGKHHMKTNNDRIRAFLDRIVESVPPPPIEDLRINDDISLIQVPKVDPDFSFELPHYAEFERRKMTHKNYLIRQNVVPATSTLKKKKNRKASSKRDLEECEFWNESIFGFSSSRTPKEAVVTKSSDNTNDHISWSEIIDECGISYDVFRSETRISKEEEEVVGKSIRSDDCGKMSELSECGDDENEYAKFAVYKLFHTLKLDGVMKDSSSLIDLNIENVECDGKRDVVSCFYDQFYRLAPDDLMSVNAI